MHMKKDYSLKANILFFLVSLFLILSVPQNHSLWTGCSDPYDYLAQSQKSFFDIGLYAPDISPKFFPRPFTVPLFYKIANSNPDIIVQMQRVIYAFSIFFLVSSLLLFVEKIALRYVLIICIYILASWWNILGWTLVLLSESLSISFLFCWIASFLFFLKKKTIFYVIIHIIVTFFFAFTRDTWPYVIVAFYALYLFIFYITDERLIKKNLLFLTFGVVLLFIQHTTSRTGGHYKLPLFNSIAIRILPNAEYTKWFVNHGLPNIEKLKTNLVGLNDGKNRDVIYKAYDDFTYQVLFDWSVSKGRNTYIYFLITHPSYSFLLNENKEQLKRILAYNLSYTGSAVGYSCLVQNVFPLFSWYVTLILAIILTMLFFKHKRPIFLFPLLILIIFGFHVLISYNGDAMEIERHLVTTNIMVQLLGFFSLTLIFDSIDYRRLLSFRKSQPFAK
jgi:hypothetical protein